MTAPGEFAAEDGTPLQSSELDNFGDFQGLGYAG